MKEWDRFLTQLKQELGAEAVENWIPKLVRFDAANLYLEAQEAFQVHWFEEHVRPKLKGFVNDNQRPIRVHIGEKKRSAAKVETPVRLAFNPDPLDPEMTLEHFIPSEPNWMAYKLFTDMGGFNPMYIYGPKGSGKTHLLMGAAAYLQKQGKRVFFVKAERFTEHVVQAIRLGQMQAFRKVYRDIDALLIDDIHIFSKKTATQEEFFHTFNTLHTLNKPILISALMPASQLSEIEPRLVSRFEWGICLDVGRTDSRLILEKKAALWKMAIDNEVLELLVEKCPRDPVLALQALALRHRGGQITWQIAAKLLKDLIEKEQQEVLTADRIIKAVANHYGVKSEDLLGSSQTRSAALPRQVAMYLCREKLKLPFQKIGEIFQRDHSTVMSSVKQIQKAIEQKTMSLPALLHK